MESQSGNLRFDVVVAYRIYPNVSKAPAVFSSDKLSLARLCLQSFRRAIGGLRVKVYALLDGCPPEYSALFRDYFTDSQLSVISLGGVGNRPSFIRQIDLLLGQEAADLVYFAEDDYFYQPNALEELVGFVRANRDADFVTPYDHPDYYNLPLHSQRQEVRPFGSRHWRTCASTCLTFLTRKETLMRSQRIFRTYQKTNLDVSLWMALTKQTMFNPITIMKCCSRRIQYGGYIAQAWRYGMAQAVWGRRYKLWYPIPSLGTHMEASLVAPCVNWSEMFTNTCET